MVQLGFGHTQDSRTALTIRLAAPKTRRVFEKTIRLRQPYPQRFKLTVPLANKAALTVVGVSDDRLVFRVHAQHVGLAGFHSYSASRTRGAIHLNARHEMFPSRGKPDASVGSGAPERHEMVRAGAHAWRSTDLVQSATVKPVKADHADSVDVLWYRGAHVLLRRQATSRPHVHAEYSGDEAVFAIPTAEVLAGQLPSGKTRLVQAWIEIHSDELLADWQLAVNGEEVFKIDPLR